MFVTLLTSHAVYANLHRHRWVLEHAVPVYVFCSRLAYPFSTKQPGGFEENIFDAVVWLEVIEPSAVPAAKHSSGSVIVNHPSWSVHDPLVIALNLCRHKHVIVDEHCASPVFNNGLPWKCTHPLTRSTADEYVSPKLSLSPAAVHSVWFVIVSNIISGGTAPDCEHPAPLEI